MTEHLDQPATTGQRVGEPDTIRIGRSERMAESASGSASFAAAPKSAGTVSSGRSKPHSGSATYASTSAASRESHS